MTHFSGFVQKRERTPSAEVMHSLDQANACLLAETQNFKPPSAQRAVAGPRRLFRREALL